MISRRSINHCLFGMISTIPSRAYALYPFCRPLKFSIFGPETWFNWVNLFETEVRNRVSLEDDFEVFEGMDIGTIWDSVELVRNGTIDAALLPAGAATKWLTDFAVLDDPRLIETSPGDNKFSPIFDHLHLSASNLGLEMLGVAWDEEYIWTNQNLNQSTPDMIAGFRIHSAGLVEETLVTEFGGSPVSLAFAEIQSALQSGAIDGVIVSPEAASEMTMSISGGLGVDGSGVRPRAFLMLMNQELLSTAQDSGEITAGFRDAGLAAASSFQEKLTTSKKTALENLAFEGVTLTGVSRNISSDLLGKIDSNIDNYYSEIGVSESLIELLSSLR